MKKTVEISDSLFAEAQSVAGAGDSTLRNLVEDGLCAVIQQKKQGQPTFRLKDDSVGGKGLRAGGGRSGVRDMIYKGRGN